MRPGGSGGGGRAASEQTARVAHQSPCLKLLHERLADDERHVILDLGPAVGDNVRYFTELGCKLIIADLHESLFGSSARQPDNERWFEQMLERDLPSIEGPSVDVILAWDLLNYLTIDQMRPLATALARYCDRRTQLFAMIAIQKEMPARPTQFNIIDPEHIAFQPDVQWQREAPRYTEPDLKRGLPDFEVDVSFLLRSGLQEYMLNYRPRGGAPGLPGSFPRR